MPPRGSKKRRQEPKQGTNHLGDQILHLICIELKLWRIFDPSSLSALSKTTKRLHSTLPFGDIVMGYVSNLIKEKKMNAAKIAHMKRAFISPQHSDWWSSPEYAEEERSIKNSVITTSDIMEFCDISPSQPNWNLAFHRAHGRYVATFLGQRHQLYLTYVCSFRQLACHLHETIFRDRSPRCFVNGVGYDNDEVIAHVMRAQRTSKISIHLSERGMRFDKFIFDLTISSYDLTLIPEAKPNEPVMTRHVPIQVPCGTTEGRSVDKWFPNLSSFLSENGCVSLGRQEHQYMIILSGEEIVHRTYRHMGSLQRYLESADQHCRRWFARHEDYWYGQAGDESDEDNPPFSSANIEQEVQINSLETFNADLAFPHLAKFLAAKGWQSIQLNAFRSRHGMVLKGSQSKNIEAWDMTATESFNLHDMLQELNACVCAANIKVRTQQLKIVKIKEELIPKEKEFSRFLVAMKSSRILQQGSLLGGGALSALYTNALVGTNIFKDPTPPFFVIQFEVTYTEPTSEYDRVVRLISIGLVEPGQYPKTRVNARFVDANCEFPVLSWQNGHDHFVLGRKIVHANRDRNWIPNYEESPIRNGDTISLVFSREDGTLQFAHNDILQPFFFAGVFQRNFYETGLNVFVSLERDHVQCRVKGEEEQLGKRLKSNMQFGRRKEERNWDLNRLLYRATSFGNETNEAMALGEFVPGKETADFLHNETKVLVLGAGGLGCEILKDLAFSGFRDIHVVDMDTIDVSNLNRQFLFRHVDVGQPKATIASNFIMKRIQNVKVTAHHCDLKTLDSDFYSQFKLVISGLDNIDARRFVNSVLISLVEFDDDGDIDPSTVIPFIDGGTEGFKGQARVILPRITSCFECSLDAFPPPTSFPLCTIAETPRQPAHCISYASIILWPKQFPDTKMDTDSPEHMQWVFEQAQARAKQFNIPGVTYSLTLGVVKNIIPAVASTNAIISAMCVNEALKAISYCSQTMHNYHMHMGSTGIYSHTFEYEKKHNCPVCATETHILPVDPSTTLGNVIEEIKLKYRLTKPAISSSKGPLFMPNPPALYEATKSNLDKSLSTLVSHENTLTITDPVFVGGMSLDIKVHFTSDA